jgi:hypothetical protein
MYSSSGCTSCSSFSTDSVSGFQYHKARSEEEGLSTTNEVSEVDAEALLLLAHLVLTQNGSW